MNEPLLYAVASAVLAALVPSFMKTGVRRTAPSLATALCATAVFLFAAGAAVITRVSFRPLAALTNGELLSAALDALFEALIGLCLFTALSTGGVNRVMPIRNLAFVGTIGAGVLLFGRSVGIWRLCCIVLVLLGTVLMESGRQKGRGCKWLLFAFLALIATVGRALYAAYRPAALPAGLHRFLTTLIAAILLWLLCAAGRTLNSLKKLGLEDWLFLLLAGIAAGLSALCDTLAARGGESSYLLPISCAVFPLMMVFSRIFHKEKMPGAAVLGVALIALSTFGISLYV